MKKHLAIIPARGGSKGIPNKNIKMFQGKPLIAYSIEEALKAKEKGILNKVIVSTDSEEIRAIALKYGAEVPFLRPQELAGDTSKSVDCMIHAVNYFREREEVYDDVVLLQPTSPLRIAEDIVKSLQIYDNMDSLSLVSCYKEESISEYNTYYLEEDNIGRPLNVDHNKGKRRQEIPVLYARNGAIFITDTEFMLKEKLVISQAPAIYVMPKERSLNIDTLFDFKEGEWLLEQVMENREE